MFIFFSSDVNFKNNHNTCSTLTLPPFVLKKQNKVRSLKLIVHWLCAARTKCESPTLTWCCLLGPAGTSRSVSDAGKLLRDLQQVLKRSQLILHPGYISNPLIILRNDQKTVKLSVFFTLIVSISENRFRDTVLAGLVFDSDLFFLFVGREVLLKHDGLQNSSVPNSCY